MKGVDGFPAFSFASTANVQRPASELVYRIGPDFSFVASILPFNAAGGYRTVVLHKGAIISKIKHAIQLKTSPARLAQLL